MKTFIFLVIFTSNAFANDQEIAYIVDTLVPHDNYTNFSENCFNSLLPSTENSDLTPSENTQIKLFLEKHRELLSDIVDKKVTKDDILRKKLIAEASKLSKDESHSKIIKNINIMLSKSDKTEDDLNLLSVYRDSGIAHESLDISKSIVANVTSTLTEIYMEFFNQIKYDAEINGINIITTDKNTFILRPIKNR